MTSPIIPAAKNTYDRAQVTDPDLRVDGTRVLRLLDDLGRIGTDPAGGLSRLGFTPEEDSARRHLRRVASGLGLFAETDQAGNLFIRRTPDIPDRPVLLMGSHVDTVPNGGRLDGTYGVVAALEVLRVLAENEITTRYEPMVAAFANEEGALFPQPFWGSLALTGQLENPADAVDRHGHSIREPLARAGGDLDSIELAAWPAGKLGAYLELHIEQGPVLESIGADIGVVDGIVGRTIIEFDVHGGQSHAGTTPMDQRSDAVATAARLVSAVEDLARTEKRCAVSTVGVFTVHPGQTNVVAGLVCLTAEIRDGDMNRLRAAEAALIAAAERIARDRGTRIDCRPTLRSTAVDTAAPLRAAIRAAAEDLDLPYVPMHSGAGHDAQIIARCAPVGMIFVPSVHGISHAPQEHTEPAHLVAGANVLLHTALRC